MYVVTSQLVGSRLDSALQLYHLLLSHPQVKVIELYRPYDGYFGFQISPTIQDNKLRVFISGFGHGLTDKLFTGLLAVRTCGICI